MESNFHSADFLMSAKEKQATAKQAFVFLAPLMSKRPMESDKERVSAGLRVEITYKREEKV